MSIGDTSVDSRKVAHKARDLLIGQNPKKAASLPMKTIAALTVAGYLALGSIGAVAGLAEIAASERVSHVLGAVASAHASLQGMMPSQGTAKRNAATKQAAPSQPEATADPAAASAAGGAAAAITTAAAPAVGAVVPDNHGQAVRTAVVEAKEGVAPGAERGAAVSEAACIAAHDCSTLPEGAQDAPGQQDHGPKECDKSAAEAATEDEDQSGGGGLGKPEDADKPENRGKPGVKPSSANPAATPYRPGNGRGNPND